MKKFVLLMLSIILFGSGDGLAVNIKILNISGIDIKIPNNRQCHCITNCTHSTFDTINQDEDKKVPMAKDQFERLDKYLRREYPLIILLNTNKKNWITLARRSKPFDNQNDTKNLMEK